MIREPLDALRVGALIDTAVPDFFQPHQYITKPKERHGIPKVLYIDMRSIRPLIVTLILQP